MRQPPLLRHLVTIAEMLIVVITTSGLCAGQYSFTPLGFVPEYAGEETVVKAVSADGSVVVGFDNLSKGSRGFRWTPAGGMKSVGGLELAWGLSADGSVIVGHDASVMDRAYRWTETDGLIPFIDQLPDGTRPTAALDVSDNGSVIVGKAGSQAFRWTSAGGPVGLGDLSGGIFNSSAHGVSADGAVVVGDSNSTNGREAFRWTALDGMVALGDISGGVFDSVAFDVSADGSVVVGRSESAAGTEAFRWTHNGGIVSVGDLAGGSYGSIATAVSGDGSVVVGSGNGVSETRDAFLWTVSTGMLNLQEFLVAGGASGLSGWRLVVAADVSPDGRTIVGTGRNPSGQTEAWIATIPPIPEPSTWLLFACGLLCASLAAVRRRMTGG